MRKVLFLVPGRLGDALMTTPALGLLKQLKPEYRVDILAFGTLGGSVYRNNPDCEQIHLVAEVLGTTDFFEPYDFVVAAHRDSKVMGLLPNIPKPVMLIEPADQQQVQALQAQAFVKSIFGADEQKAVPAVPYLLFPTPEDTAYVDSFLPGTQKLIGFHLGCHGVNKSMSLLPWRRKTEHKKIWPLRNFLLLGQTLKKSHGDYRIVLTGGSNEAHLAQAFLREMPDAIDVTGKTNVQQLASLMQHFSVFVSPDTGPMHVACAVNVPLVTFFGPTNERRTGPYPAAANRRVIRCDDLSQLHYTVVLEQISALLG